MNTETQTKEVDNRTFRDAFLGAILVVITAVFSMMNFPSIAAKQAGDIAVMAILGAGGLGLLIKAIWKDKVRGLN